MDHPVLDELDRQLVAILAEDARVSNRQVAAQLHVTEGTIRGHIKRLQQDGLIAFTAITSFEMAENAQLGFINVQADVEKVRSIANTIAELPLVNGVMITIGQFNILALCLFGDIERLVDLASNEILGMEGVHHVETAIAVRTIKYNSRMAKITAREN